MGDSAATYAVGPHARACQTAGSQGVIGHRCRKLEWTSALRADEPKIVRTLFTKLVKAELKIFPPPGSRLDASIEHGVYIIYSPPPTRKVVHVGRTYRGSKGLRQRLKNHLHGSSSFTKEYLNGHGRKLRRGYSFRYLIERSARRRALLEAYASRCLCPAHLGVWKELAERSTSLSVPSTAGF